MNSRNGDIEVLRGVAVLYVVIHHAYGHLIPWKTAGLDFWFHKFGGWAGVDLFFVISGFVIAAGLLPRLETATAQDRFWATTMGFWARRCWRLMPSALFWMLAVLLCCLFFNSSGVFGSLKVSLEWAMSAVLQVANFHMAGVFGQPGSDNALFPLWTLSLEVQFYLLLPVMFLVCGRWLPHVLGVIVLLQLACSRDGLQETILRTDGIFLGVLLAMFSRTPVYRLFEPVFLQTPGLLKALVLGVLLFSLAFTGGEDVTVVNLPVTMITLLSAILVFIASYDRNYLLRPGWIKSVFIWLGARSYGIYLIHIPVFYLSREIWYRIGHPASPDFNPAYLDQLVGTAVFLILLLSELNYRLLESPCRKLGREKSRYIETETN